MRSSALLFATELRGAGWCRPRSLIGRLRCASVLAAAAGIALFASGCSLMPAAAPTALEVESENESASASPLDRIVVLDIDDAIVSTLSAVRPEGFAGRFSAKAPPADLRIAVGDTLQVSVIEQSPGLLSAPGAAPGASPGGGSLGAMPFLPVTVDHDGTINVPFAGSVRAVGMTTEAVRKEIEHRLVDKAVNPQVQVALLNGTAIGANSATVGGEVNRAGVLPLRPSGSRLLDVIAEAGELIIRLSRQRCISTVVIVQRPCLCSGSLINPTRTSSSILATVFMFRTIPRLSQFLAHLRKWVDTLLARKT